ncbi:hypothetical protein BD626DRAFT_95941 [Schizophyllum amplum]|uniref:Polymerase nucleotidyl transferase domain-containing protein n=1 Tax=Schizophyllum amplum TaxID=97359 RepID=A0A550C859_9AGAR|nr:hypothetical protein BD626DRAFT_95941 [Auriculariopsis ampla]
MSAISYAKTVRFQENIGPCLAKARLARRYSAKAAIPGRSDHLQSGADEPLTSGHDIGKDGLDSRKPGRWARCNRITTRDVQPLTQLRMPPNKQLMATKHPYLERPWTVLQAVQTAVQRKYGQEYTVEPFGSYRYGLWTKRSDLDLVILDPYAPYGWPHRPSGQSRRRRLATVHPRHSPYNIE